MAEETVAANLRERVLGRVELLLSLEHLEVVGQPLAITIRRAVDGVRERLHRPVLPCLGLTQLAQRGEGVGDLPERGEDGLFIQKLGLLPLSHRRTVVPEGAARVEQRPGERAGDGPYRRAAAGESRELGARRPDQRGQAELREELGLGDSDASVGAHELLLRLAKIGPPRQEGRRQARWHDRHHGLVVHRRPPENRAGALTEQNGDLILLGDDVALELRDGRLGPAEGAFGPSRLELRGDT